MTATAAADWSRVMDAAAENHPDAGMAPVTAIRRLLNVADGWTAEANDYRGRANILDRGSNCLRWQAAELIAAQLDMGKTTRQLGAEIGKSHTFVGVAARVWRTFGNQFPVDDRESFDRCCRSITGKDGRRTAPRDGRAPFDESLGVLDDLIAAMADGTIPVPEGLDMVLVRTRLEAALLVMSDPGFRDDPRYTRWEAAARVRCGATDTLATLHVVDDDGTRTPAPIRGRRR